MEKILFGAYLSVLAAFLTAIASIVKLVNEKESKTTDYRQAWTESVRSAMSELISSINLQASNIIDRAETVEKMSSAFSTSVEGEHTDTKSTITDYLKDRLTIIDGNVSETNQAIQKNYALIRLHFKQNDLSFARVEQKFELLHASLHDLRKLTEKEKSAEREALREKINSGVIELTGFARDILKTEWESVKAGEPAYKTTKKWALYGGVAAFSILAISGLYMLMYAMTKHNNNSQSNQESQSPIYREKFTGLQENGIPSQTSQVVNINTCNQEKSTHTTSPSNIASKLKICTR